jgi:hypothetical protein
MEYVIVIFNVDQKSVDHVIGPFIFEDSCHEWMKENNPAQTYEVVVLSPHGLD